METTTENTATIPAPVKLIADHYWTGRVQQELKDYHVPHQLRRILSMFALQAYRTELFRGDAQFADSFTSCQYKQFILDDVIDGWNLSRWRQTRVRAILRLVRIAAKHIADGDVLNRSKLFDQLVEVIELTECRKKQ